MAPGDARWYNFERLATYVERESFNSGESYKIIQKCNPADDRNVINIDENNEKLIMQWECMHYYFVNSFSGFEQKFLARKPQHSNDISPLL